MKLKIDFEKKKKKFFFVTASGLQLYIARDGTASFGQGPEVKSRMPGGIFKQVVMDNPR